MGDEVTYTEYVAEPTEVVTVEDANSVLQTGTVEVVSSLNALAGEVESLTFLAQEASTVGGTVTIDSAQWDDFAANVDRISEITSATLFLCLVLVCIVSALLGARLWHELVAGWRHG